MWATVLPSVQTTADELGFGDEWQKMCAERFAKNVQAVANGYLAEAANYANIAVVHAAHAIDATAWAATKTAMARKSEIEAWRHFDPAGLLERLNNVSETAPAH